MLGESIENLKKNFKFPTLSPHIFAPYIKNLGMCFAILVYFDFGYVCAVHYILNT